ncbi:hypothetical protein HDU96_009154 [Phlyctochytrium bullatum]|nr:hypothetical protein HDU96_009154 [Phlyctochytrium bullatum]
MSDDGSAISDGTSKRDKTIREIVETERRFNADMKTLKEIYVIPATRDNRLSAADIKTLFAYVDGIIDVSDKFLEDLEEVTVAEPFMIGEAFLKNLEAIEQAYADYCRHNEAAIVRVGELMGPDAPADSKQFLKECQIQLQGRTGAWDLLSLVIKPVQRVLKYPLLVKWQQLLKETPSSFPDHASLVKCSTDIEKVAENINEYKKRKDTVEKYVEGKTKINVIQAPFYIVTNITHFSLAFGPSGMGLPRKSPVAFKRQLKQATGTGGEVTVDAEYDKMAQNFEDLHRKIQSLLKDEWKYWLRSVKEFLERQMQLATAFEEVYELGVNDYRGPGYKFLAVQYREVCELLAGYPIQEAEKAIQESIIPALQKIEKVFKDLTVVIKKRAKKKLDYDRKRALEAKGETPDRALELSADEYRALHAELLEELPKFLRLASQYLDHVFVAILNIQANVHMEVRNRLEPVAEVLLSTRSVTSSHQAKRRSVVVGTPGEIVSKWSEAFEGEGSGELRSIVDNMTLLHDWKQNVLENPSWKPPEVPRTSVRRSEKSSHSPRQSRKVSGGSDFTSAFRFPRSSTSAGNSGSSSPYNPGSRRASVTAVASNTLPYASAGGSKRGSAEELSVLTDETSPPVSPTWTSPTSGGAMARGGSTASATSSTAAPRLMHADEADFQAGKEAGFEAVAVYSFQAEVEDEMNLENGDYVWVDLCGGRGGEPSEDWWHGYRVDEGVEGGYGAAGWFPAAYVQATS